MKNQACFWSDVDDLHFPKQIAENITGSFLPVLMKLSEYFKEN